MGPWKLVGPEPKPRALIRPWLYCLGANCGAHFSREWNHGLLNWKTVHYHYTTKRFLLSLENIYFSGEVDDASLYLRNFMNWKFPTKLKCAQARDRTKVPSILGDLLLKMWRKIIWAEWCWLTKWIVLTRVTQIFQLVEDWHVKTKILCSTLGLTLFNSFGIFQSVCICIHICVWIYKFLWHKNLYEFT